MKPNLRLLTSLPILAVTLTALSATAAAQDPTRGGTVALPPAPLHTVGKARNETSISGASGEVSKTTQWTYASPNPGLETLKDEPGRLTTLAFFETGVGSDKPNTIRALFVLPYSYDGMYSHIWLPGFGNTHWLSASTSASAGLSWRTVLVTSQTTGSPKVIGVAPDQAIAGVRVCLNKSGDKIKGARIYGARFGSDGKPIHDNTITQSFERPNCKTWSETVRCPSNQVAVGIRAYAKQHSKGFSGLSLICAPYTTNRNGLAVGADITFTLEEVKRATEAPPEE